MAPTDWLEQLGFLAVALFTLGSALGVILARRVLHAALWLLPTLFGVAGAFALMGAHLLFAMQILVYVGAITVLIVFAVLLLEDEVRERLPRFLRHRVPPALKPATDLVLYYYSGLQHVVGGVVGAGIMLVVLLVAIVEAAWFMQWRPLQAELPSEYSGDNVRLIGELLLTRYLLPFEVASVVLLVALVGAVVIARRDIAVSDATCVAAEEATGDAMSCGPAHDKPGAPSAEGATAGGERS